MEKERIGTVLVVDDDVENIDMLAALLESEYEVIVATDGASAVVVAADQRPHLILLDIMMSGMDGHEVYRIMKQNKVTRDIPVIFLSSLSNETDQEEGLNMGAVDYITKPFSPSLVRARVRNHVKLRRAQLDAVGQIDTIQDAYQKLRELEEQRDDMAHMLLHDLRTPLTSLLAGIDYCLFKFKGVEDSVPELTCIMENAKKTGCKLKGMLTTLLDVGRFEAGMLPLSVRECRLSEILHSVLGGLEGLTKSHSLSVSCSEDELITCDPDIMERVIANLLMNSLQYTPEGGKIILVASREKTWTRITVTDTGPGIPKEYHETIFQKFGRVMALDTERSSPAGLGLTFCQLAVEAHGGSIHVESSPGEGASFSVRLPRTASAGIVKPAGRELPRVAAPDPGKEVVTGASVTIFLVSSDRMLLNSLMRYLETNTNWSITAFHDLTRAVRTALIVRPDIVLLDIDMQHTCNTDIFLDFENVIAARKSTIAYYTELLLPEETEAFGYSLARGGQPLIPKRLPLSEFRAILIRIMYERAGSLQGGG
ncbi:MAG: response regulator [Deltaproteobacteria bacterium]